MVEEAKLMRAAMAWEDLKLGGHWEEEDLKLGDHWEEEEK